MVLKVEKFITWKLDDDIRLSTMQHVAETKGDSPSSEDSFTAGSQNDDKESDEVKKVKFSPNFCLVPTKDYHES